MNDIGLGDWFTEISWTLLQGQLSLKSLWIRIAVKQNFLCQKRDWSNRPKYHKLNQKLNEKSQCSNTLHKSRIKSDCEYLMVPNHEPEGSLRPFQTIRQSIRGRLTTSAIESSWSASWNSCPEKLSSKSRHGNKRISDIRLMQWMDSSTSNYNWKIIWWRLPVG